MPKVELTTLLDLVGTLTDSDDPQSANVRFRKYLRENLKDAADVREYAEDALANSGDQFNKALQDLINHLGQLLGFEVEYGRYRGVRSQVGFDGLWRSTSGWSLVVETKTTDVYTVKTATLLGYLNELISDGRIEEPNQCLGLYVYGRFDAHTSQLENAIVAEGRQSDLRVVSVESLLNLLELKQEYRLPHKTVLDLLLPAPVRIDPLINLIVDVVAEEKEESDEADNEPIVATEKPSLPEKPTLPATEPHPGLVSIDESYTGRGVVAITYRGRRYPVRTWREATQKLFEVLHKDNPQRFTQAALTVVGRKRPYFTRDEDKLRKPKKLPGTDIFYETNLSANFLVKVCYTILDRMGLDADSLDFQTEA